MMNERKPIFNVIPAAGNLTALLMNVFFFIETLWILLELIYLPLRMSHLGFLGRMNVFPWDSHYR